MHVYHLYTNVWQNSVTFLFLSKVILWGFFCEFCVLNVVTWLLFREVNSSFPGKWLVVDNTFQFLLMVSEVCGYSVGCCRAALLHPVLWNKKREITEVFSGKSQAQLEAASREPTKIGRQQAEIICSTSGNWETPEERQKQGGREKFDFTPFFFWLLHLTDMVIIS